MIEWGDSLKLEDELYIKKAIQDNLKDDERILVANFSKEKKSMYVTLVRNEIEYLSFRISNHAAHTGYYSNRTFSYYRKNVDKLSKELSVYLEKIQWYHFTYDDFFTLYTITFASKYNVSFYIDDLYSIFSNEEMGIVFYQQRVFNKKKRVVDVVSEKMTQSLRKLFATGLIYSADVNNSEKIIFITKQGKRMIDGTGSKYLDSYVEDYQQINWLQIDIPNKELI